MVFGEGEVVSRDDSGFKICAFRGGVGVKWFIGGVEVWEEVRVIEDVLVVDCAFGFRFVVLLVKI